MALLLPWTGNSRAAEPLTFESDIRPILKVYCFDCHGAGEMPEGNLDLRLKRSIARGGDGGPALLEGDATNSRIVQRMKAGEMPPSEKKVPAEQIAAIERWIATGAATARDEPEQLPPGIDITPEDRAFWSFQPIGPVEPPQLAGVVATASQLSAQPGADIVRSPVDAFVLARLREEGARFSPDADPRTLLRRAAFDLTGLPPTQNEIEEFLADPSDEAYEKALDKLLASPQYGERWGRHWLDVAGYADSEGNGSDDTPRPYAYKYRDYVIRAFNADKPFDEFIVEQLAGDELVPLPWTNLSAEQIEKLAATGFLRTATDPTATGSGDLAPGANQMVADAIKIVSSSLLGLTVGCAQCHDHKYDPIPQADYYRLRAVFEPALDPSRWRRAGQRLVSLYTDQDRAQAAAVDAQVQELETAYNAKQARYVAAAIEKELLKFPEDERIKLQDALNVPADQKTEEQKQLLAANPKVNISPGVLYQYDEAADKELKADQAQIAAKRAEKKVEDFVSVLNEDGALPPTHLFHRGDYRQPQQAVTPGDLTIAAAPGQRFEIAEKDPHTPTSGRRLALARHLTDGRHPLVGRVLANRVWLHHFGHGLVDTPGDFGVLGLRPTHPELLDWLASQWVSHGWSLKRMHKLMMLSTVYRQSSRPDSGGPVDARYSRFALQRLDAEALRDCMLAASGRLDRTQFGPAIPAQEDFVGQVVVQDDAPRRSVYLQVRRSKPISFLAAFDAPVMTVNCEKRVASTGAPQSLMLMNSDFVLNSARKFAERIRQETPPGLAQDTIQPLAEKFPRHYEAWRFGYGEYDAIAGRISTFTPLPSFIGATWQGSDQLPDAQTGWALLHAAGGHAGNDQQHATIRRWVAPLDGVLSISGKLHHRSENGDGVRGRIVSSRAGLLGEWLAKNGECASEVSTLAVQAGDTVDFVTDCVGDVTSDSFEWATQLKLVDAQGQPLNSWDSLADFHGPLNVSLGSQIAYAWRIAYQRDAQPDELELAWRFLSGQLDHLRSVGDTSDHELAALTNLCQQLLSSNEFLYVD